MFRRLKYRLLRWLMKDICDRSYCNSCYIDTMPWGPEKSHCRIGAVYAQAKEVWKIGGDNRG